MGAPRRRVASPLSRLCRLTFLMPPALPGEPSRAPGMPGRLEVEVLYPT
jgi:hypothetical protein